MVKVGGKGYSIYGLNKSTREQNRGPRANWMSQCTSHNFIFLIINNEKYMRIELNGKRNIKLHACVWVDIPFLLFLYPLLWPFQLSLSKTLSL